MQKRVFLVHGHQGSPDEGWFPWIRSELVARQFLVGALYMPDPEWPDMQQWITYLAEQVGHCDEHTYFIGHSLGVQAILRYIQTLPPHARVGGAVFVAGFERMIGLEKYPLEAKQLEPWLREPIHWESIRGKSKHFTALFSDNDECIPLDNVHRFDVKLSAQTIVLHRRGHFAPDDYCTELPEALDALLAMTKNS